MKVSYIHLVVALFMERTLIQSAAERGMYFLNNETITRIQTNPTLKPLSFVEDFETKSIHNLQNDFVLELNQRNRHTNQSKYFGDFYSGSSASGNGDQAWCNTGSQSLRGPQVVDQSLCKDAFDAFDDSSFTYLGVLTTNDARFFQSNGNNGDPDILEFPTGCYVKQGSGNSAIKSFAFIQTSQTQQPSGNQSIQPVCLQNVCPTGFTGKKAINSCESFVYCTNGEITDGPVSCGDGTLFDNFYAICNHNYHVNCDGAGHHNVPVQTAN